MKRWLLSLLWFPTLASAASVEESIASLLAADVGRIAFCKSSVMDELQIIGEPRKLSKADARRLGAIFGANETYFEKLPDGTVRGSRAMCMPHWDFKVILMAEKAGTIAAIRLCTSCKQVAMQVDGVIVDVPNIRTPAFRELTKLLDAWFPDWAKASYQNKRRWEEDMRERRL